MALCEIQGLRNGGQRLPFKREKTFSWSRMHFKVPIPKCRFRSALSNTEAGLEVILRIEKARVHYQILIIGFISRRDTRWRTLAYALKTTWLSTEWTKHIRLPKTLVRVRWRVCGLHGPSLFMQVIYFRVCTYAQ